MKWVHMQLDTSGRPCPIPIIELSLAIRRMPVGAWIELVSTDPAVHSDLRAWCESSGNELLSFRSEGERYVATVVKRAR